MLRGHTEKIEQRSFAALRMTFECDEHGAPWPSALASQIYTLQGLRFAPFRPGAQGRQDDDVNCKSDPR